MSGTDPQGHGPANPEAVVLTDVAQDVSAAVDDDPDLTSMTAEQDAQAVKFAQVFLEKIIRLRGVRIDRDRFLGQELRRLALSEDVIIAAIASSPVEVGVSLAQLDALAEKCIAVETNKSAAAWGRMSFCRPTSVAFVGPQIALAQSRGR